jgi:hypothetical protein
MTKKLLNHASKVSALQQKSGLPATDAMLEHCRTKDTRKYRRRVAEKDEGQGSGFETFFDCGPHGADEGEEE